MRFAQGTAEFSRTVAYRVLVVDDYPDSSTAVCTLLRLLGHDARSATTGRAALEEMERFEPHVVMLDIGLPDISGYDVARALRRAAAGRPLYLAALTGWGQSADRIRAFEAGFDEHVIKPSGAETLKRIIAHAEQALARS